MSSISGAPANPFIVPSNETAPATPFSAITVTDPPATVEMVSITLSPLWLPWGASATDFGSLSDPLGGGTFDFATHTFTEAVLAGGTPTGATGILGRLAYTPPPSLTDGLSATIGATISVNGTVDPNAPVVLETVTPPLLTGATSSIIPVGGTGRPFNQLSIQDQNFNYGAQTTATITLLDGGVPTDADGALSGTGIEYAGPGSATNAGPGTYIMPVTRYYNLQTDLSSLVFSPTPVGPGVTRTTVLALSVTDTGAPGLTTTTNNTSVQVVNLQPGQAPLITGTSAQTVQEGNVIQPFTATTITDNNSNPLANAALAITGGGTLSGAGLTPTGSGTYTIAAASPANLNTILHGLTFTPPALGGAPSVTSSISLTVADGTYHTTDTATQIQEVPTGPPPPSNFIINDQTAGKTTGVSGDVYSGPVPGITNDLLLVTSDNLSVSSKLNAVFIHTGSGMDAIDIRNSTGNSVLDGGTGSNFLTGGSGNDTFFVDDRSASSNLWSTVNGFHAGDAATIWGVTPADFNLAWSDNKGAVGFTGLTLDATSPGKPIASLTLVGYSQADLTNGRLSVAFATDPGSGSPYMYIQGH